MENKQYEVVASSGHGKSFTMMTGTYGQCEELIFAVADDDGDYTDENGFVWHTEIRRER